jgi:tetratricopeptide (TPR) repeat protein
VDGSRKSTQACLNDYATFDTPTRLMSDTHQAHKQRIFLSYAHKVDANPDHTADLVDAIKLRLELAGLETWIDKQQLLPGRDWREGITRGIDESDRVLSFLSPRSVRDPGVCLDEIGIAMSHKHGAIATLLADKEVADRIPASVAHIQYLDVSDWQQVKCRGEAAWDAWLNGIVAKILEIIAANHGFAGEIEALQKILTPMPDTAKIGKLVERGLIGRAWVKEAIGRWRLEQLDQRMFWLMGGAGMGKSAIAADLVHKSKLQVIAYHFCDYQVPESRSAKTFATNLAFMLAARLPDYRRLLSGNIQALPKVVSELSATELVERLVVSPLRNKIDGGLSTDRLLVVVDALDEAEPELADLLAKYLDAMPPWLGFVVTSRPDIKAALARYPAFELQMSDARNDDDLWAYLSDWRENDPDAPLDPATQSALIASSQGNMLYLALAREGYTKGLFSLDNPSRLPQGIGAVYLAWMKRQFGGDPLSNPAWTDRCYPLLELLCATPEPLPLGIAGKLLGWKGQERILTLRPMGSLITQDSETLRLCHRSLGEWLSDPEGITDYWVNLPDGRLKLAQSLLPLITTSVDDLAPHYLHRALPILLAGLDQDQSDELLKPGSGAMLDLIERLSDFWAKYANTKAWHLQASLLTWIVGQRDRRQGGQYPDAITSLSKLGTVLFSQGAYSQASELFERTYAGHQNNLGPDHPDTLASMSTFARSLYALGQYPAARSLQEKELERRQSIAEPDVTQVLNAKTSLARTLYALGDYATSKDLHQQVLSAQRQTLGEEHANTVGSMSFLASALFALGDCREAESLNATVLALRTRMLGAEHPGTLTSASYLASALYSQGNFEGARKLQAELFSSRQRTLGELHPDTLQSHGSLALSLRALGHIKEALSIQETVVLRMIEVLGEKHPSTLFQISFLADTRYDLGDYASAKALQERVLQFRSTVLGDQHPDSMTAAANLALTLNAEGAGRQAEQIQAQVVVSMKKILGEYHPDTLFSQKVMARIQDSLGRKADGDSIREYLAGLDQALLEKRPVHYTNTQVF